MYEGYAVNGITAKHPSQYVIHNQPWAGNPKF